MSVVSDCCCPPPRSEGERRCAACTGKGAAVNEMTIKALLTEAAMNRFEQSVYRFCAAASCPVVYFDDHGRVFETGDIRVPVWHKEPYGGRGVFFFFCGKEQGLPHQNQQHRPPAA